ncbi:hypothetical protein PHMEG_000798 [Phytophthora megakarya]|uniref:Reverse transcriptase RNase H-like domain-containing protein n=1 Tax=Phytophthora megakarya TaxID=4795 RepID=A0A225X4Q6_9STRA|nr:hypothetical protein PHMEG_000798 [Phytophthora megakarya]
MAARSRVPSNLPKFTGKREEDVREWLFQRENACRINGILIEDSTARLPGITGSAMEKPASEDFLHWSSTTRSMENTWGFHFETSNHQAALREKLHRLKQSADIETYNGEYSALIFRLRKLENPKTLSEAMDLAVKFEVTHFVDEARGRQKKNKRNTKIQFSNEQLKTFKELKQRLCSPPLLHLPDSSQPTHFRTDETKFAVGGVLFQVVDGIERPITYTSRKMKYAELNYPTEKQEPLAIVHALPAFRIYCLDKPPVVETNHKSMEGLFTQKMANCRLGRWYDILAEYQPMFSCLPGVNNGISDALSKRQDLQPETKSFHDFSVTGFDDTSVSLEISEGTMKVKLVTQIKNVYEKDREIRRAP